MSVAKLAMEDMMPVAIAQANLEPWEVFGWCTIEPMPFALTRAQMKNVIPAVGTTNALTVNRCRI